MGNKDQPESKDLRDLLGNKDQPESKDLRDLLVNKVRLGNRVQ